MENKLFVASIMVFALAFVSSVGAVSENSNVGVSIQVQEQTEAVNQAEDARIQTKNNEQIQTGTSSDGQTQNQNRVENQGEDNQVQNQEREGTQTQEESKFAASEERRIQVSNAVQEILQVAERSGGIGQQVKIIAQTQNQNQEKLETSLQKIQSRSGFVKFLAGVNYGEINNAKKILAENHQQIQQLNEIKTRLTNDGDQQNLFQQIQIIEKANLQVENSLDASRSGFSLFGWFFRWAAK